MTGRATVWTAEHCVCVCVHAHLLCELCLLYVIARQLLQRSDEEEIELYIA